MNKKIRLKINAKEFLDWFYSDEKDILSLGQEIVDQLRDNTDHKLIIKDSLDKTYKNNLGYLPLSLINNKKDVDKTHTDGYEIAEKYLYKYKPVWEE